MPAVDVEDETADGNKEIIECTRRCMGVSLSIQVFTVWADFYILPMAAACQAVLGVQWLEALGPIETDYKKLSMSFTQSGQTHILKGINFSELAPMSEKRIVALTWYRVFCSYDFRGGTNPRHQMAAGPQSNSVRVCTRV